MSLFLQPDGPPGRRLGLALFVCSLLPAWAGPLAAAESAAVEPAAAELADTGRAPLEAAAPAATFSDSVNVTATRGERSLRETPGQVSVIDAEEIAAEGYRDVTDLVRFLPGVYVDGDLTRLGASGFNIRGIGGNRVATQVDGVPTAEQFDFGPFRVTQYALDLDLLESVEIVRSAGSSLYGSDALGGVVAFRTRDPRSYLGSERRHLGLRAGWDGRAEESSGSLTFALGGNIWAASLVLGRHDGHAFDNFGERASEDASRTAPNPIDRVSSDGLLKLAYEPGPDRRWLLAAESFASDAATEVYSSRALAANPSVRDYDAVDTQARRRLSLEGSFVPLARLADSWLLRLYGQTSETTQETRELRVSPALAVLRQGLLRFEQDSSGLELESRKSIAGGLAQLLTYGTSLRVDDFDQLRHRRDLRADTGAPLPASLLYPTKYFPRSQLHELGLYLQDEIHFASGKGTLLPGLRYDRYELDADQHDAVYFAGNPGTPVPVDLAEAAVSPRLAVVYQLRGELSAFVQYAHGFRAPPMSWVNNGFTNQAGGYRTLPNAELDPERSENLELGLRGAHRRGQWNVVLFDNRYEDFIELFTLPFDPQVGLLEFQPRNLEKVRIRGLELDGRARFGAAFELRAAAALIEGENASADQPLLSIAPPQLVIGLGWRPSGGRLRGELIATVTAAKKEGDLPSDAEQFRTPASETFDAVASLDLPAGLVLQLSAYNLTDQKVWRWQNVQGLTPSNPALDRYTGNGRQFAAQLRWTF